MKVMASWQAKLLLLLALVAGTTAIGVTTTRGQQGPPSPAPGTSPIDTTTGLLARNRDRLAVCVQGVGQAAGAVPAARQRIEQVLGGAVAQHPSFGPSGYGRVPRTVQAGCPGGPHLLRPGVEFINGRPGANPGSAALKVAQASPYRLYVFLLPPEEIARVIKGQFNVRTVAQEMLCEEHSCAEVSTGLYLTPDEVNNDAFLREWLLKGLGLEEPFTLPTDRQVPVGR